jgi:hypothetical protein
MAYSKAYVDAGYRLFIALRIANERKQGTQLCFKRAIIEIARLKY